MRLRATLRVRNEVMLAARGRRGWSQASLARAAGVTLDAVWRLEALDYRRRHVDVEACAVATALVLPVDAVLPEGLAGQRTWEDAHAVVEMDPSRLLAVHGTRWLLEDPSVTAERREMVERCLATMGDRERRVVRLRYMDELTLEATGQEVGVTRERVRQIEARGIRQVQRAINEGGF